MIWNLRKRLSVAVIFMCGGYMSVNQQDVRRQRRKANKNITMKDVAEDSGVSITTVSHVINETRYVEIETKEKVLLSIAKLKFSPNINAQRLKGMGTKTIGVVVSLLSGSYFHRFVSSLSVYANSNNYDIVVCDSMEQVNLEERHIEMLLSKGIDGLIYAPVDHRVVYSKLLDQKVPFIQIDRFNENYESDYVGLNNYDSSFKIVEYLKDTKKCTKIGFAFYGSMKYRGERLSGYLDACKKLKIYDEELIKKISSDEEKAIQSISKWISSDTHLDAIMCSNAEICYDILLSFNRLPELESYPTIFTFDANKWFNLFAHPVISIDQKIEEMSKIAFKALLNRIEGETAPFEKLYFDYDIIEFQGCSGIVPIRYTI